MEGWWAVRDSNLRPTDYESAALTNWANGPSVALWWLIIIKLYSFILGGGFLFITFNQLIQWWSSDKIAFKNLQPCALLVKRQVQESCRTVTSTGLLTPFERFLVFVQWGNYALFRYACQHVFYLNSWFSRVIWKSGPLGRPSPSTGDALSLGQNSLPLFSVLMRNRTAFHGSPQIPTQPLMPSWIAMLRFTLRHRLSNNSICLTVCNIGHFSFLVKLFSMNLWKIINDGLF